ncbi:FadR family transcriptional regulator [Micrococcales bacterium 31B]|nr:FadR family transcriptional regulator [Micrococcales bacterium 31B]
MRAHETVVRYIEKQLASGELALESRLPSERELAEHLGVGRSSVREAIRVLEAMGVIRTAVGSGPHAGAFVVAEPTAAIASTLRMHLATNHWPVSELIGMRLMIETWALATASQLPHDAPHRAVSLRRASELLEAMDAPDLPRATFQEFDAEFHACFVSACNNSLIVASMNGLRGAINSYVLDALGRHEEWPRIRERLAREHHEIFEAVLRGEPEEARLRGMAHIEGFYRDFVTDFPPA